MKSCLLLNSEINEAIRQKDRCDVETGIRIYNLQ